MPPRDRIIPRSLRAIQARPAQRALAGFLLLGALALVLYSPSLDAPFVFDSANLERASLLHITSLGQMERIAFAEGVPRRVGLLSFALNFYLDGLNPRGYHLVNLLLHLANAAALWWLSYRILGLPRIGLKRETAGLVALAGASLFLVHPVATGAVSYVYQRFTTLSALFFLVSLGCYLEGRISKAGAPKVVLYAASLVSALAALGTKENAGMLPLVILILEIVLLSDARAWRHKKPILGAVALLLGFVVIGAVYLGPNAVEMMENDYRRRGFTLGERLLTESRVVVHYLTLLVFPYPSRLTLDYDVALSRSLLSPPSTLLSIAFLASWLSLALARLRKNPLFAFATLWFFANLVVESSFVPLDLAYEHRVYLPGMMLFPWLARAALVSAADWRVERWTAASLVALALLGSVWTFQRNRVWADPVALWEDNARKAPGKARVHANLGKAYAARGDVDPARRAFERAIELDPGMVGAYVSLANLHLDRTGDFEAARALLEPVVESQPGYAEGHLALGVLSLRQGDSPRAVTFFERALELDESHPAALYNLASAHFNLGDYRRAAAVLETAISYWSLDAKLHALRGAAFFEMGELDRAGPALARALELDPSSELALRYRRLLGESRTPEESPR